jgi:hypothetical protein
MANEVYLVTGFYIPGANTVETDGLSGAILLGKALMKTNKHVAFLTDPHNKSALEYGLNATGISPQIIEPNFSEPASEWIHPIDNTVLVAVERPGKGVDGIRRTMRGVEIPTFPLDDVFIEAPLKYKGVKTISCADGLNEVGMGKLPRGLIKKDEAIQSVIEVDHLVISGTADWSAYGLIAGLSIYTGRDLLPTPEEQEKVLSAIIEAGAVDGITKKREMTVDTLPLDKHQLKVQQLRTMFQKCATG